MREKWEKNKWMEESSTFKKNFLGKILREMWKVIFKEIYKRKVNIFYCIVRSEKYAATKTRKGDLSFLVLGI